MSILKKLLIGVLLVVVVLFGIWIFQDNSAVVPLYLAGFSLGEWPLAVWIIFAFVSGALMGILVTLPSSLIAKKRERRYRQRLINAERKLAKLETQHH